MKKIILFLLILVTVNIFAAHPKPDFVLQNNFHNHLPYTLSRADSLHGFDVLKYVITIDIDANAHYIQGDVVATVTAEEDMTSIQYELEALNVTNVLINDQQAGYTYQNGIINIETPNIVNGETFTTQVFYEGTPSLSNDGYGLGMFMANNYVMTLVDPSGCRWWWPAYDHPWDKAITDLHVTIRDDWLVASNGIRTSIEDNGDGTKTHHWIGENPIATYLVVITASNFTEINQEYNGLTIQNFVNPSQYQNALETLSNLPYMIEVYSQMYGDYPFEKYGNAVVPISTYSAMEHQTMTTLGNFIITGNHQYETIIAHELSHHWFGDCLTPLTWKDVWLSESFATYSEEVYTEHWQGWDAAKNYVQSSFHNYYFNWAGSSTYTIYDPSYFNYFAPPSYEKGASVLHMLRLMVGDEMFFNILQTYFQTYKNKNVITSDFVEICEDISGLDLTQFFDQWIFNPGTPTLDYSYFINSESNQIMVSAMTTANAANSFYMDIPAQVNYSASSDSILFSASPNTPQNTIISISSTQIESVDIDPSHWVLCRGFTLHSPEIVNAFAGDSKAIIFWNDFWDALPVDGYNVYRSTTENGDYEKLNDNPITATSYEDNNLENGVTYFYKITAIKDTDFQSLYSDVYQVTPVDFPLNQGILLVDETDNGNGSILHPTDSDVDDFYQNVIAEDVTTYDYNSDGELQLSYLANFSTVLWYDDDISISHISNNLYALGSYLAGGGNLIISGWKTAQNISDFLNTFFDNATSQQINQFLFTKASSETYTDLNLDTTKLSPNFNGTMPFVTIFPESNNSIYQFTTADGSSNYDGVSCAMKKDLGSNMFVFLGFPLYYFQQDDVAAFMQQIISEINQNDVDDNNIQNPMEEIQNISNYPNPFNPTTNISYSLKNDGNVKLTIYNLKGEIINTLINEYKQSGNYNVIWNGKNNDNKSVSSGVYFYRFSINGHVKSVKKCILMK